MTSKTQLRPDSQHAPLARVLAFVLLVLVAYGATAGAAHRHGASPTVRPADATSMGGVHSSSNSSKDSNTGGQCLICRLHQNLLSSLLSAQPHIAPPSALLVRSPEAMRSYLSQTDAPRRGRAPPSASLL